MEKNTSCVIDSIVDSINKHKTVDLSRCADDRKNGLKVGDTIAGLWFNDPNYYAGKLEKMGSGELGIPIGKGSIGLINDADHIVKINKL